ncbi:MAG: hypothetical protein A2428_11975 [Bdellovibrionales bacterium RIFOXYC1_FULL_54_43]|nr:MAG: hypothetical protein A2428_11975 [Bdellovibrionales bacterium RIFOXYC1_FULL_54_43]
MAKNSRMEKAKAMPLRAGRYVEEMLERLTGEDQRQPQKSKRSPRSRTSTAAKQKRRPVQSKGRSTRRPATGARARTARRSTKTTARRAG